MLVVWSTDVLMITSAFVNKFKLSEWRAQYQSGL